MTTDNIFDRFWAKVDTSGDCWIWQAYRNAGGYGVLANGEGGQILAHVLSYNIHIGPVPDGMFVLHKRECNNPSCVRPDHLYAGTRSENAIDAIATKNLTVLFKPGGNNISAKLTEDKVQEIREIIKSLRSQAELAKIHNCSPRLIWKIHNGYIPKKLTIDQVIDIRLRLRTQKDIAEMYDCSQQLISAIRCNQVW
jgi:hypothetical protein